MKRHGSGRSNGFTLVEIVAAVTVTAILAALLIQVMGTNVQRSTQPLAAVQNDLLLRQVMENITADYKHLLLTDAAPLATFQNRLHNGAYWTPANAFTASVNPQQFNSNGPCQTFDNCFIAQDCTTGCNIFKVTITQNSSNLKMSALFTR